MKSLGKERTTQEVIKMLSDKLTAADEERADFFRNTDDRIKLNDIIVEKNFWSLLDKSEIFSDQYFRKIFNFRFYGERSDFDFCPILKIGRS